MTGWTAEELDTIGAADELRIARHGASYVDPMVSPGARAATLRLTAR